MGMVGGGPGAFIGPIHRIAAELDRDIELVAGAFSRDAARSREAGERYAIDADRAYPDLATMIEVERTREDGIDFVSIVTPNRNHLPSARLALAAGLPVMSDKPMTATLEEAVELAGLVRQAGRPYALTYTYSGYPLVREARARVRRGDIGTVRKVAVEYMQGWLSGAAEGKQAEWRVDPAEAGEGGCIGDIGVHAFQLAEFVTDLRVVAVLPDLASVVPGRRLDDDASLLLRFENGARGSLLASQIAFGERNGLSLRVWGDSGSLCWRQERPNELRITGDASTEIVHAGTPSLGSDASAATRTPAGHPEGYLEAFANLYRDFARLLRGGDAPLLPDVTCGLRSMAFVQAAAGGDGWTNITVPETAA